MHTHMHLLSLKGLQDPCKLRHMIGACQVMPSGDNTQNPFFIIIVIVVSVNQLIVIQGFPQGGAYK